MLRCPTGCPANLPTHHRQRRRVPRPLPPMQKGVLLLMMMMMMMMMMILLRLLLLRVAIQLIDSQCPKCCPKAMLVKRPVRAVLQMLRPPQMILLLMLLLMLLLLIHLRLHLRLHLPQAYLKVRRGRHPRHCRHRGRCVWPLAQRPAPRQCPLCLLLCSPALAVPRFPRMVLKHDPDPNLNLNLDMNRCRVPPLPLDPTTRWRMRRRMRPRPHSTVAARGVFEPSTPRGRPSRAVKGPPCRHAADRSAARSPAPRAAKTCRNSPWSQSLVPLPSLPPRPRQSPRPRPPALTAPSERPRATASRASPRRTRSCHRRRWRWERTPGRPAAPRPPHRHAQYLRPRGRPAPERMRGCGRRPACALQRRRPARHRARRPARHRDRARRRRDRACGRRAGRGPFVSVKGL